MGFIVRGIDMAYVEAVRSGTVDANGQKALLRIAHGAANPCRHCLGLISEGEQKLVLSYQPFEQLHPYAEVGPIFLHATACQQYVDDELPDWFSYQDGMDMTIDYLRDRSSCSRKSAYGYM